MAIIRTKRFSSAEASTEYLDVLDIIDTPQKLLTLAANKSVETDPLDVESLAKLLGIDIKYEGLENELSGLLYKDIQTGTWIIKVEKNHHRNRQRYTIAHEIAHFCLHRHLQYRFEDQIFFRGGNKSKEEYQANDFASAILMPDAPFRKKIEEGITNIEDLSKIFQVSSLALRIRAKALGLKGHGL